MWWQGKGGEAQFVLELGTPDPLCDEIGHQWKCGDDLSNGNNRRRFE